MFSIFFRKCRKTLQLLEISRFQLNFQHDYPGDLFNFRLIFLFNFHRAAPPHERCGRSKPKRPPPAWVVLKSSSHVYLAQHARIAEGTIFRNHEQKHTLPCINIDALLAARSEAEGLKIRPRERAPKASDHVQYSNDHHAGDHEKAVVIPFYIFLLFLFC